MESVSAHMQCAPPLQRLTSPRIDDEVSILVLALSTSQALRALIGLKLAPLGLAPGQDRLLATLHEKGPLTVSGLAEALNVRPSTVSKMMDRLAARGLTKRNHDDVDRRRISVELTDEGRAACQKLHTLCRAIEDELRADLDDDGERRMMAGLELLNEAVGQRLKRLR
ncbi:MarR family winged helix-turn-helix transcriptional regulator [Aureimonas phyllosphaerae]|nr:MarR family transcriptional regulator [Aureimonas phyllosphaerae]SFF17966.1 DNA-binding transcriptional regulator, MarR family [Aureimonas phyllosphaerae]